MNEINFQLQNFCQYSRVFKGNTKRTVQTYRHELSFFFRGARISNASDITRTTIENFLLTKKLDDNWSNKTIRNRIIAIRIFSDWCIRQGFMEKNHAREIDLPRIPKQLPRYLPKDDAITLLEWTQHFKYDFEFERSRAVAIIAIFMFSGVRL